MAWQFDGAIDSLTAPLVLPTDRLTVSFWFRPAASSEGVLFETYATPLGIDRSLQLNVDGSVSYRLWNDPGSTFVMPATTATPMAWNHLLLKHGTMTGGHRLSINGVSDLDTQQTQSYFTWQTGVRIGNGTYVNPGTNESQSLGIDGAIAEIAIWDAELTEQEEAALLAGVSPLAFGRSHELLLYQDLIRPLNRPGIGPDMSITGSPTIAPHAGVIMPGRTAPPGAQRVLEGGGESGVSLTLLESSAVVIASAELGQLHVNGANTGQVASAH